MKEYWDKIPVTFVDGVQVDFWRVSEARLRRRRWQAGRTRPDADTLTEGAPDWAPGVTL